MTEVHGYPYLSPAENGIFSALVQHGYLVEGKDPSESDILLACHVKANALFGHHHMQTVMELKKYQFQRYLLSN